MASPRPTFFPAPATGSTLIDAMTHGYSWMLTPDRTIDWSISGGFAGETWANQQTAIDALKAAFDFISYYVDIRFNYVGAFANPVDASVAGSEINVGLDGANRFFGGSRDYARGIFPNDSRAENYPGETGDILLNMASPCALCPWPREGPGSPCCCTRSATSSGSSIRTTTAGPAGRPSPRSARHPWTASG